MNVNEGYENLLWGKILTVRVNQTSFKLQNEPELD